jgi:hypothetical protein
MYVAFAALRSWLGAYASMTFLHRAPSHPPPPLGPMADWGKDAELAGLASTRTSHWASFHARRLVGF